MSNVTIDAIIGTNIIVEDDRIEVETKRSVEIVALANRYQKIMEITYKFRMYHKRGSREEIMAHYCARCKQKIGWITKWKCKDGMICTDCRALLTKAVQNNLDRYTISQINYLIDNPEATMSGEQEPQQYKCSNSTITFDPINKSLSSVTAGFFKSKEIPYSAIMGYEYKEDGKTKGTFGNIIGAAVVGGVLFGGAGAIVGALTQKRGERRIIENAEIDVIYKENGHLANFIIHILDSRFNQPTDTRSSSYVVLLEEAKKIMIILDEIIKDKGEELAPENSADNINIASQEKIQNISIADEIKKLKDLLDEGVLSSEEFNKEKSRLLNQNNPLDEKKTYETTHTKDQDEESFIQKYSVDEKRQLLERYRKLVENKPDFDSYKKIFAFERDLSKKDIIEKKEYFAKFINDIVTKKISNQMEAVEYIKKILTYYPVPDKSEFWSTGIWERDFGDGKEAFLEWAKFFDFLSKHVYPLIITPFQVLHPCNYLESYDLKMMLVERANWMLEVHEKLINPYPNESYHDLKNKNINILLNLKRVYQMGGAGGYTKMFDSLQPYIENIPEIRTEFLKEYKKEDFQKKLQAIEMEL